MCSDVTTRLALALFVLAAAAPARAAVDVPRDAKCRKVKAGGEECHWTDAEGVDHISARVGPSAAARAKASKVEIDVRATRAKSKVRETSAWDLDIEEASEKYKIPHELVRAVIVAESNFDPGAVSPVGARGLMQLMPATAEEMFVTDSHDPVQNIHGGVRYLRILANQFNGDIVRTVAAYNAGPEAVRKAKGIPRFAETQGYVKKVIRLYRIYKGLDARS